MGFLEEESARRQLRTYLDSLEEERRKIQVFQRELPLCFDLVSRSMPICSAVTPIEGCRQQLLGGGEFVAHGRRDSDEETSSDGPVFEEFIPIKKRPEEEDEEENNRRRSRDEDEDEEEEEKPSAKKPDWMRSVQLWTSTQQQPAASKAQEQEDLQLSTKPIVVEPKRPNGAFRSFHKEKRDAAMAVKQLPVHQPVIATPAPFARPPPMACAASSTGDTVGSSKGTGHGGLDSDLDKEGQSSNRKVRRCWSPELHGRFLEALQQLGGAHVATPKQIREFMKVDGLTNDEVKSHLQKYRLHTRRSSPPAGEANSGGSGASQQQPIVLVGGLWARPLSEYPPVATADVTNGHHHSRHLSKNKACDARESPATSTSSHTISSH